MWSFGEVPVRAAGAFMFRVVVSRTLIMRTIKPIEQLVPVS